MATIDIYKKTSDRLKSYNVFSGATIKVVAEAAKQQSGYATYKDFFNAVGLEGFKLYTKKGIGGVPVIDVPSRAKKQKGVLVVHVPMGNSLDPNQLYQIATISLVNPGYRVIGFGNPSGKPFSFKEQNLSIKKQFGIAFAKNTRPLVEIELDYIKSQSIDKVTLLGYSYGSMKALVMAEYMPAESVEGLVLVDPVAHPRYPQQLLKNFTSTFKPLGEYVNRTHIQSYLDARKDAVKLVDYSAGLARPINIAIGFLLSRIDFVTLLERVLSIHSKAHVTVAWATKSEIGNDAHLKVSMHRLKYDEKRQVESIRLINDTHAFANDIHLHAAIIHEGMTKVE